MLDFLFGEKVVKITTIREKKVQVSKRMYSEEEVKKLIVDFLFVKGIGKEVGSVNEWFEQFKKK